MATVAAARSFIRSSARSATSRFSTTTTTTTTTTTATSKPKSNSFSQSPFSVPKRKSISPPRIFRSPVELSCCVESLLPYHTATASALLTSMLSVSPRHYGWTLEDG